MSARAREPGGNAPPGPEHASRGVTRAWVLLPSWSPRTTRLDGTPGSGPRKRDRRDGRRLRRATVRDRNTTHTGGRDAPRRRRGEDRRLRRGHAQAIRERRRTGRRKSRICQPRSSASLRRSLSGFTATGFADGLEHRQVRDRVAVRVRRARGRCRPARRAPGSPRPSVPRTRRTPARPCTAVRRRPPRASR